MPSIWTQQLRAFRVSLSAGCSDAEIQEAERTLGCRFPAELRSFLSETNGLYDIDGQWDVAWPLDRLVTDNLRLRHVELWPTGLLAFGDDGTGAPFCTPSEPARADSAPVLNWQPIDGEVLQLASSLRDFWPGWLSGKITT